MKSPAKPALRTWAQFSMMGRRMLLVDGNVQEFLGFVVAWGLAVLSDMFLVVLSGDERSSSTQKLRSYLCWARGLVLETHRTRSGEIPSWRIEEGQVPAGELCTRANCCRTNP